MNIEKWYRVSTNVDLFRKGIKVPGGITYSERIEFGKYQNQTGFYMVSDNPKDWVIRLATPEELRKFLPEDHPDYPHLEKLLTGIL